MKKKKEYKIYKFIFMIFFVSFLVIYFSEITGYYQYQKFESDVATGKEVDLTEYLSVDDRNYNNVLSKLTSKLSDGISYVVQSGVENAFKFLSKLVEE